MKRIFIIHGWDGSSQSCWFPWLKKELEDRGFIVQVLDMPRPERPTIEDWVSYLANMAGELDENTFFIGHSIGCQTILRYIEKLQKPVGGVVCVAGWFRLPNLATDEEKEVARPWLETTMDYEKIRQKAGKIIAIFSDNDPDVDLSDKELFEKNLNAKIVIEHNKGHFSDDAGVKELPSVLEAVMAINKSGI